MSKSLNVIPNWPRHRGLDAYSPFQVYKDAIPPGIVTVFIELQPHLSWSSSVSLCLCGENQAVEPPIPPVLASRFWQALCQTPCTPPLYTDGLVRLGGRLLAVPEGVIRENLRRREYPQCRGSRPRPCGQNFPGLGPAFHLRRHPAPRPR